MFMPSLPQRFSTGSLSRAIHGSMHRGLREDNRIKAGGRDERIFADFDFGSVDGQSFQTLAEGILTQNFHRSRQFDAFKGAASVKRVVIDFSETIGDADAY